MLTVFVYVPESHLEKVKSAMFTAGAGRSARYEQCSWQTRGQGQFVPRQGSIPYIGNINQPSQVSEYKLEMTCGEAELPIVIAAMKKAHPYEEPAYGAISLLDI